MGKEGREKREKYEKERGKIKKDGIK